MKINDKALLVKLSITMPGNTRKDKGITDEVKKQHAMGDRSGRWLKQLYPDEAFDPLAKISNEARQFHYDHSLPWTDEGWRILPTAMHWEYTQKMRALREQFLTLSETHFVARLGEWLDWARKEHNGTFDSSLYPPANKLLAKFSFGSDYQPIPSAEDFRVQLSAEEMAAISADLDSRVATAVQDAQNDLWRRLAEPVKHIAEKLQDPKSTFRDSLVGNVREIVGLIPQLNLAGDPVLETIRQEIERELAGVAPQTLRDDKTARKATQAKATAILEKMKGYGFGG